MVMSAIRIFIPSFMICSLGMLMLVGCVSHGKPSVTGPAIALESPPSPVEGVPEPPQTTGYSGKACKLTLFNNILFQSGKSYLSGIAKVEIDTVVKELEAHPKDTLEIIGHASVDETLLNRKGNQDLGLRRAETVRSYMIEQGVAASRLTTKTMGTSVPAVPNDTESHRKLNRRVEFLQRVVN
jgi:OOP family OmpA-OmpF porin